MHAAAVHLAPVLAAEKSKTAFYIAGGVLVVWALILSLGLGLRRPKFPGNLRGEHVVIAISSILVVAAVAAAVLTAGTPEKAAVAASGATKQGQQATSPAPSAGAPPAGSAAPGAPAGQGSTVKLAANPSGQLSYNTKTLSARAGTVTISFTNSSPLEHNVTIAGKSGANLGATPTFVGGTKALILKLSPGTYTFFCSVPGHRFAGMEGKLTVS